jgi:hypothetical protein
MLSGELDLMLSGELDLMLSGELDLMDAGLVAAGLAAATARAPQVIVDLAGLESSSWAWRGQAHGPDDWTSSRYPPGAASGSHPR